ncbi:MAG: hypothetical protein M3Y64_03675, partial [Gemmatimonadota bacterium]|nr:hypothetical protein [Gemmatimonadota bacterium]
MNTRQRVELEALVQRWVQTVHEIERGYTLTFDDYLNDLDVRNSIAQQLDAPIRSESATPASVQRNHEIGSQAAPMVHSLQASLADADARFRAATNFAGKCVWGEA